MKGVIHNFRGGRHTQYTNQVIILPENAKNKGEAAQLIGKKVKWQNQKTGKDITGKIVDSHGNKGAVRAIFRQGLPGQAIGTTVVIQE